MAAGKLVADTNLTLLGHVDFCHLEDAGGQLVANGDGKLLALHLSVKQLVFLHEVDNQLGYEEVLMLVVCPVAYLYVTIFQIFQSRNSELRTLSDYLCAGIVFNAH